MLSLTYLTFQSPAGARAFLQAVSPSLGAQLQERAYGADCRPVYANIRRVDDGRCSLKLPCAADAELAWRRAQGDGSRRVCACAHARVVGQGADAAPQRHVRWQLRSACTPGATSPLTCGFATQAVDGLHPV